LLFQAYLLQRRASSTVKDVDTVFGMLLQIKLLRHILLGTKPENNPYIDEGLSPAATAQKAQAEQLAKSLEGVKKFKERVKK
jgi:hypothetical protein